MQRNAIDIYHDTDLKFFPGKVQVQIACQKTQSYGDRAKMGNKGKTIDHGISDLITVTDLYVNSNGYCRWTEVVDREINEGGKIINRRDQEVIRVGFLGFGGCDKVLINGSLEPLYGEVNSPE